LAGGDAFQSVPVSAGREDENLPVFMAHLLKPEA